MGGFGGDGQALLDVGDGIFRVFFVFQRKGSVGGKFGFAEGLEGSFYVHVAFSEDDAFGSFLHFSEVLEVDAEKTAGQGFDGVFRLDAGADVVAEVGAESDSWVAAFDGFEAVFEFVVKGTGAVVVNGDADVVLFDKFFQAIEGVWGRVGRNIADSGQLGEFEEKFVFFVVFGEAMDSVGADGEVELLEFGIHPFDGCGICGRRVVNAVRLDPVQPQFINFLEGFVRPESTQGVGLYAHGKASILFERSIPGTGFGHELGDIKPCVACGSGGGESGLYEGASVHDLDSLGGGWLG